MAIATIPLNANYKGEAGIASNISWALVRSGNGTDNDSLIRAQWRQDVGTNKELHRSFIAFDTSVIADGVTVSSAKLKVTGKEWWRNDAKDFYITSGTQASTIVDSSYEDHVSTTEYGAYETTESGSGSGSKTFSSYEITLNSAGIAAINKTGITKFCIRPEYDFDNNLLMASDSYNIFDITSASLVVETTLAPLVFNSNIALTASINKQVSKSFLSNIKLSSMVNIGETTLIAFYANLKISSSFIKKTFINISENIKLTSTLSRIQTKILNSTVKLTSSISKLLVTLVNFTTNLSLSSTIRIIKDGIRVGIWEKVVKTTSDWTKQAKNTSTWTKQDKEL